MTGGEISGFIGRGGINIASGGTFNMSGGLITGNIAGVTVASQWISVSGTFIMNGGTISNNDNPSTSEKSAVWVNSTGTFTMNTGTIRDNLFVNPVGGGVYVANGGTFNGIVGNDYHASGPLWQAHIFGNTPNNVFIGP